MSSHPGCQENGKVPTRRGQVHVFGQPFLGKIRLHAEKMDQSPDFAVLLPLLPPGPWMW